MKLINPVVVSIFVLIQVLTKVSAAKYPRDGPHMETNDDSTNRRLALAMAGNGGGIPVNEDYGDMSDGEYLRRAIKTLSADVASLRRTVRDLYGSEIEAIRKTVERLSDQTMAIIEAASDRSDPRAQSPVLPQNSLASLLGLGGSGALAGGFAPPNDGRNFGAIAAGGSLRDELAQLLSANLPQQNAPQYGQGPSLQSQTLSQLLSGLKDGSGLNSGLAPASSAPAQLLLSRLG